MNRTFTCILCPNGCEITADFSTHTKTDISEKHSDNAADLNTEHSKKQIDILSVTGNLCPKGEAYVRQELTCPSRTIASSVLVTGGTMPLCSVRLTAPVPKEAISQVMEEIKKQTLAAPVKIGQIIIKNVCGFDSDVIATRNVERPF